MTGWTETRLDRVATVNARIGWKALTAAEYQEEGFVFLSTPNIKQPEIDFENVNYISQFRFDESPELRLQVGDVLLAKDGNTLGITNVVTRLPRPATVNGSIAVLRPFAMEGRFLRYQLDSAPIQGRIQAFKDGMGVPHLFQRDINRFPLVAPPLVDQRAIADYLDAETARLDALIAKKQRLIQLLDERWQSVVSDRVWGSTGARTRLKHLTGLPSSGNRDHGSFTGDDSGVPCLRGLNVRPARLDLTNLRYISEEDHDRQVQTQLQAGDIVIVRSGLAGAAVGIPPDLQPCNCVDLVVVRRSTRVDPRFLEYVINSREAQEQVAQHSAGALLTHFNAIDAGNLLVPDLPIARQQAVAVALDHEQKRHRSVVTALTDQVDLLAEHRQALITNAVEGGLPPQHHRRGGNHSHSAL